MHPSLPITKTQMDHLQIIYPGNIRAIADAVKALKQNNPLGGIAAKPLAKKAKMILALISNTLLYNDERFARTSCNNPRMMPKRKATGISIHRAPNAKAKLIISKKDFRRGTSNGKRRKTVHEHDNPYAI